MFLIILEQNRLHDSSMYSGIADQLCIPYSQFQLILISKTSFPNHIAELSTAVLSAMTLP
jgi:hypothetical protein